MAAALVQLLADYHSKFGLRVKTLSYADFPSGKDYHHRKPYMQSWLQGEQSPYVFHMCWTQNKVDKIRYLKQLGGWFLMDHCDETSIRAKRSDKSSFISGCCSAQPVVSCFYRDKASKSSCASSPPKDKGRPSWW